MIITERRRRSKPTIIGARKIPKELIKVNKDPAELRIFHGTMTQPPRIVRMMAPRRILIHLGNKLAISLAPEITVAEMLTQIWAIHHETPAKKAAARPPGPSH